jgi:autotransporter-associated beta strand protein
MYGVRLQRFATYLITRVRRPSGQRRLWCRPRLEAFEDRLAPATHTWTGMTSSFWSVASNWKGGVPSGDASAALVFPDTAKSFLSNNDFVDLTVQSIKFTGNKEYTIGGNPLTLKSGGISLDSKVTTATDRILLDLALGTSQTWRVTDAGATLDVEGVVSGKYRLSKSGPGTLMLGADNLFNGTTLNAGTLTVGTGKSLGTGQLTLHGGKLQSSLPLTLDNAFRVTANSSIGGSSDLSLTGAGTLSKNFTLTVTNTGTTTFSGKLTGAGGLSMLGTGVLVLAGDNTYTGVTDVASGKALINGTQTSSDVTVHSGATLGGSGKLGSINAAGAVSPGGPGAGLLQSRGAIFNAGSSFIVKLNGINAGSDYDQLVVNGMVDLTAGPALNVTASFVSNSGDTFTIITSKEMIAGTFGGLPDGATLSASGITLQINYSSNAVTLTNVSSPMPPSFRPPDRGGKPEAPIDGLPSMTVGDERPGQLAQEEQTSRPSWHERARDPGRRLMVQSHAQRQSLPLHAAIESTVRTADDPLGRKE